MGLDKQGFRDVEMGDGVGWGCESISSVRRPVGRKVIRTKVARWSVVDQTGNLENAFVDHSILRLQSENTEYRIQRNVPPYSILWTYSRVLEIPLLTPCQVNFLNNPKK
jgi:hypothetical protein